MNNNLFKNKAAAMVALLFFVLLGAGSAMAKTVPGEMKTNTPTEKNTAVKKNKVKNKEKHVAAAVQYQFNGTTLDEDKSASNYSVVTTPPSCVGSNLPCTITVTGDLQTWLNAHTAAQIKADADALRN